MKIPVGQFRDRLLPIVLSQGVGLLCGVASVKIASKYVQPADYGTYGVFLSFTPIGVLVVHAGLLRFITRSWNGSPDRAGLLQEVLVAGGRKLPWLLFGTLAAAMVIPGGAFPARWALLFVAAVLLSLATAAQNSLQAERAHWADFVLGSSASLSRSILPLLLYILVGGSLYALEVGYCLHAAIFAGGMVYVWRRYRPSKGPTAQLLPVYEGWTFMILSLAGWTLASVNRWLVVAFLGREQAGYFTLAGNMTLIVTGMLGVVFMQFFQPGLYAASSEEPEARHRLAQRIDQLAFVYTLVAVVGVVLVSLLLPHLLGTLIGEAYRPALGMVLGVGMFGAAISSAQFYDVLLLAGHRERACVPVAVATAGTLTLCGLIAIGSGAEWFFRWLTLSPLIPWLVTRPLARRRYFAPR